jgi:hypothetical protein
VVVQFSSTPEKVFVNHEPSGWVGEERAGAVKVIRDWKRNEPSIWSWQLRMNGFPAESLYPEKCDDKSLLSFIREHLLTDRCKPPKF